MKIENKKISITIGQNINLLRKRHKFTLERLAEKTGLSIALISRIENGMLNPSLNTLEKIANSLGVEIEHLLQKNDPPKELKLEISDRIKQRMELFGLETETLSKQCKIPIEMLAQQLNGEIILSIHNLIAIAKVLKVDLNYFFESHHEYKYIVSRNGERPLQEWMEIQGKPMYIVEVLFDKFPNQLMEPVISTHIGKENHLLKASHTGEEFFFVLEGTVKLFLDEKEIILNTGDAIYFDSSLSHAGISIGNKPAKTLHTHFAPQARIKMP